ncbi:DUF6471 domain-containing protein [Paraburkholderia tropica]|uniref:DUF6471 domain-containing protein n=1 Tax=Paraburkholderia tropica TaxID=92647 RepID=UPI000A6353E0|nr:DUF6471 domain-containing protein [Paraburkholderia tropica]
MSDNDTPWTSLASRVVRVVLARQDTGYSQLLDSLTSLGVKETERSLASRVSRGRIKASVFLQIMAATNARIPERWHGAMILPGSWDDRVKGIVTAELARHPLVSMEDVAQRMIRIGAELSEKTLTTHLIEGTLSLPELLQFLVVMASTSLEYYVDYEVLVAAAQAYSTCLLK